MAKVIDLRETADGSFEASQASQAPQEVTLDDVFGGIMGRVNPEAADGLYANLGIYFTVIKAGETVSRRNTRGPRYSPKGPERLEPRTI